VNCDPIARWYRWLEYIGFGGELERRRFAFLPQVAAARRVLVLGEGDGRFLARLVEQNLGASIDYVDLSDRMLELACRRAGTDQVTYRQGDALTLPLPSAEYDLVVTNFFLDCFEESDAVILVERIAAAARPRARWLIAEFRQPESGWQALWARVWLRSLYLFFRVTTGLKTRRLVDHHPMLRQRGFRPERAESALFGLLASELWTRP
jgi:ubiquinone/menaquinone biosynthesis C-methylase UbiE